MSQDFATNNGMITAAFKRQFHDTFEIQCQQTESVLQVLAKDRGPIGGSSFTVNDLGSVKMQPMNNRFQDTQWSTPEAGTRLAVMRDFGLFVPIEPRDEPKLSADPTSEYMQLCLAAEHRERDITIYKSLGASVQRKTEDGEEYTATPLPASQIIAAGGLPITKQKIVKARTLFRKNHADKGSELYMIYNSEMLEQIMIDDEMTKWDRETIQNIMDGDVAKKWGGFIWLPYEELADGADNTEAVTYAVAKGATHFGRNVISNFDIGVRLDKSNVKQIGGITSYGAARASEQKIVKIGFKR